VGGGIAVDAAGNVVVAGATVSADFPVTAGAFQTKYGGGNGPLTISPQGYVTINSGDGFVAKLDPTGSKLLASTYMGGSGDDVVAALALDSHGAIWVGGPPRRPISAESERSPRQFGGMSGQKLAGDRAAWRRLRLRAERRPYPARLFDVPGR